MGTQASTRQDRSIINYEHKAEIDDSKYRIAWIDIMEKGNYKNPSTYKKVEVLLLCWEKNSDDLEIEPEVKMLKSVFENQFRYNCRIEYLDNRDKKRLQIRLNFKVASFVNDNDAPNTLFIVYYAGHGRPGRSDGQLELHGQTSPNDKEKRIDRVVWNGTEDLLKHAEADVLEIFDCCYAGTLGWTRGDQRSIEYLAATMSDSFTPVPGDTSFTSALIWALKILVKEKPGGRFTTVDLLNKINDDAPNFPKTQTSVLSDRLHKNGFVGHIVLHPLEGEGPSAPKPQKEANRSDSAKRTVTLGFDFDQKPSLEHIQTFGHELNKLFKQRNLGVNGIRWGGIQPTATGHTISFIATSNAILVIKRLRRAILRRQIKESLRIHTERLDQWLPGNSLVPPTPSSLGQLSSLIGPLSPTILVSDDNEKCLVANSAGEELNDVLDDEAQDIAELVNSKSVTSLVEPSSDH